jgi:hypothetical protein
MRVNTRAFAMNNYPELKMLNPSLPILVREGTEAMPTLTARFGAPALSHLFGAATQWPLGARPLRGAARGVAATAVRLGGRC